VALIRINDASKVFTVGRGTAVHALDSIALGVREGEFVTLVGRSGCGKSTLLRLIAGLVKPTSGGVEIDGSPVRRPRRDVGLMLQKPALLPWRTALDNVLLPVEVMRKKRRDYLDRAHELFETTGLAGFEARYPRELSGGMQQRVSLCRSLIHDPAVLLMDEPFAALDALTREDLSEELQQICARHRKTVIFVTHSIEEAVLLADRVVVMSPRPGRIQEIVTVDAPRPRSLGASEHAGTLAEASRRLRELLFARTVPDRERAVA
jgi:NitT/TauT family transport system ATP-binding protein